MSYELGRNVAKNLKQITKDPSDAEPWARYLSIGILLSFSVFFAYLGFEHDAIFAYVIAGIIALYSYSFAEKEIDAIFSIAGKLLKWIIYAAIAFAVLALISDALDKANPIVLAILFGAWMIVVAIQK